MKAELIQAVAVIKAECQKYKDCNRCPLRSLNASENFPKCGVVETIPDKWRFKK